MGHRTEDHGLIIVDYPALRLLLPARLPQQPPGDEVIGHQLAAEIAVLGVEAARDLRPLRPEFPAHADVLVARAGENKSDILPLCLPRGRIKYPFAEERLVGGGAQAGFGGVGKRAQLFRVPRQQYAGAFFPGPRAGTGEPAAGQPLDVRRWFLSCQPGSQLPQPGQYPGAIVVLDGEQRLAARAQRLPALQVGLLSGGGGL